MCKHALVNKNVVTKLLDCHARSKLLGLVLMVDDTPFEIEIVFLRGYVSRRHVGFYNRMDESTWHCEDIGWRLES